MSIHRGVSAVGMCAFLAGTACDEAKDSTRELGTSGLTLAKKQVPDCSTVVAFSKIRIALSKDKTDKGKFLYPDADALWVTEVWTDQSAHRASLQLPSVQAAIAKGRPLIATFDSQVETTVLGGIGLKP